MSPRREWVEPEEPQTVTISRSISYYLSQDAEELDIEECLAFIKEMKMELAIYYARIEALQKLEKKVKDAIRYSGEIPEVEGVVVKFGKPSTRTYTYTKKLIECAEKDNMEENLERLGELYDHLDDDGQVILREIRQDIASRYIPLRNFIYTKEISPRITIDT